MKAVACHFTFGIKNSWRAYMHHFTQKVWLTLFKITVVYVRKVFFYKFSLFIKKQIYFLYNFIKHLLTFIFFFFTIVMNIVDKWWENVYLVSLKNSVSACNWLLSLTGSANLKNKVFSYLKYTCINIQSSSSSYSTYQIAGFYREGQCVLRRKIS